MKPTSGKSAELVLASASPRRLELLRQIGIEPSRIDPPTIDEAPRLGERPIAYARRMALEKLETIAARHDRSWIVAADTVVACGRRILPKAENEAQCRECLRWLSGRRHKVFGAIAVETPMGMRRCRLATTTVTFRRLDREEIRRYLDSREWIGKAGGYAIQGLAAAFIPSIQGSYSNVVGLSLPDLSSLLTGLGWHR